MIPNIIKIHQTAFIVAPIMKQKKLFFLTSQKMDNFKGPGKKQDDYLVKLLYALPLCTGSIGLRHILLFFVDIRYTYLYGPYRIAGTSQI